MGLKDIGQGVVRVLSGSDLPKLEAQNAAQQVEAIDFPMRLDLDGRELVVRPLERRDRDGILAFARALPEHDLLFLRRDITIPENVDEWITDVEEGRYASIIAAEGDRIVGYATVASDGMTWTRHVAELRLTLAEDVRGQGLGRLLTEQSFRLARERGLRKIIAQMTTDQKAAIRSFERLGFEREAILRNQVIDRQGNLHDLQIMGLDLERFRMKLLVARNALEAMPNTP
jgi:L-amino acid N-acyltransferase YncA